MIWGAISRNFKSELALIDGALTSRRYQDDILDNHVRPLAEAAGAGRFMLVDDNARPHRSALIDQNLGEDAIERIVWPAKSPDLNPIEHVWAIMRKRITELQQAHHTLQDLRRLIRDAWDSVSIAEINRLLNSMPRRATVVYELEGDHTHY